MRRSRYGNKLVARYGSSVVVTVNNDVRPAEIMFDRLK